MLVRMHVLAHCMGACLTPCKVNVFGTQLMMDALIGLMKPGARIINVSSSTGILDENYHTSVREKLHDASLQVSELHSLAWSYIDAVSEGKQQQLGWPSKVYGVSKAILNQLTRIYARDHKHMVFASVHPGWCKTEMGGSNAPLTASEGAAHILSIAFGASSETSGCFWIDGKHTQP